METNPPTSSPGGAGRDTTRGHHPPTGFESGGEQGDGKAEARGHVTLPSHQAQGDTKNEDSLEMKKKSPYPTPYNPFNYNFPKQKTSE